MFTHDGDYVGFVGESVFREMMLTVGWLWCGDDDENLGRSCLHMHMHGETSAGQGRTEERLAVHAGARVARGCSEALQPGDDGAGDRAYQQLVKAMVEKPEMLDERWWR